MSEPEQSLSEAEELLLDGARYGDVEDVRVALEQRVNVNVLDANGRTGATLCTMRRASCLGAEILLTN